jgi:hypothetical protein
MEAEEAFGEHGEEHEPAGYDRLDDRELQERERPDVKDPRGDGGGPADRPPLRGEQAAGAAQGVTWIDVGRLHRPALAQQEARVRHDRTGERQEQPEEHDRCRILTPLRRSRSRSRSR